MTLNKPLLKLYGVTMCCW